MNADHLATLIRRNDRAWQAGDVDRAGDDYERILQARPIDPAGMAILLKWLARENATVGYTAHEPAILEHVASRLEAMAGRVP